MALIRTWRSSLVLAGSGSVPAALALALTAGRAPARAAVGIYFLVALVPALQVLAGAFFGRPAALATGAAVAALTIWQVVGPPRALVVQPTQWPAGFTAPEQQYGAALFPPPAARAAEALARGGKAVLGVCLGRGNGDDLEVLVRGQRITASKRPAPSYCWLEFSVPAGALPQPPAPLDVLVRPLDGALAPPAERSVLVGGYTRPRPSGGPSGGAQFFDGARWQTGDLSPLADGTQQGRLFVELRVFDAAGRFVEVWY
jgi:hypothetical protein